MTSIATHTGLGAAFRSAFALKFTLDVTTQHISRKDKSVSGRSHVTRSLNRQDYLKDECINQLAMDNNLLRAFRRLNSRVRNPAIKSSWYRYDRFIKRYGTHIIKVAKYGSIVFMDTYAKASHEYTKKQFALRACLGVTIPVKIGELGLDACGGFSTKDISHSRSFHMKSMLLPVGGTPDTCNQFLIRKDRKSMEAHLNAGKNNSAPVEFMFHSIADILLSRFGARRGSDKARALNLKSYVEGFLSFGCELRKSKNRKLDMQRFELRSYRNFHPNYRCTIPRKGCHSHRDCHYNSGRARCYASGPTSIDHNKDRITNKLFAFRYNKKGNDNQHCKYGGWFNCKCRNPHRNKRVVTWTSEIGKQYYEDQ